MGKRLEDMLLLVSRVQEKRGDLRFVLRQDPAVRREVHVYLDDMAWLQDRPALRVRPGPELAGKQQLGAALQGELRRPRRSRARKAAGGAVTLALLCSVAFGAQVATAGVPGPAAVRNLLEGVGQAGRDAAGADRASPAAGASAPRLP